MIATQHTPDVEAGRQPASQSLYRCCLDEQPDHLVPKHSLQLWLRRHPMSGTLTLNPSCHVIPLQGATREIHGSPFNWEAFPREGEGLWVEDPGRNVALPFWIGPELSGVVHELCAGSLQSAHLSERMRWILATAGVLMSPDDAAGLDCTWARNMERSTEKFLNGGYCPVSGLIHPFHISALRRYYRRRIRRGELRLGDDQSSHRYVAYNDPVACFFHRQLAPVVSMISGTQVRPSYCYLASYQQGSVLEKHTDREQCEISVTFCLDYSPEPERETAWPIHLHPGSRRVIVYQALGDGLLYRGCEVPHSRLRIPDGHTSTSLLFHYVPMDFQERLD